MSNLTPEKVERCKAAMDKPAPREALALIASGRVVIAVTADGDVEVDAFDGRMVRDPDNGRRMTMAGAWPLYAAGMIDQYGLVTDAGRALLDGDAS